MSSGEIISRPTMASWRFRWKKEGWIHLSRLGPTMEIRLIIITARDCIRALHTRLNRQKMETINRNFCAYGIIPRRYYSIHYVTSEILDVKMYAQDPPRSSPPLFLSLFFFFYIFKTLMGISPLNAQITPQKFVLVPEKGARGGKRRGGGRRLAGKNKKERKKEREKKSKQANATGDR